MTLHSKARPRVTRSSQGPRWRPADATPFTASLLIAGALLAALAPLSCTAHAPPGPARAESAPALVPTASGQSDTGDAPVGLAPSGTAEAAAPAAVDSSLPVSVYRAAGVPELDREWSVEDYARGARALLQMGQSGRDGLPRKESQRSGEVFARLVAAANFSSIPKADTATSRARLAQQYLGVFPGLLQLYSPASDGLDFAPEQAELVVSLLELLKLALDSSRDYVLEEASWQGAYDEQKAMAVGILRGIGNMLAETDRYPGPLRERLREHTARLLPTLVSHLDAEQQGLVPSIDTGR